MRRIFTFPNPVNEYAARTVAAGVVVLTVVILATQQMWLTIPLAYGFLARVASGPTLSPLGQLATRVIAPRLAAQPKLVAGPPKRFAQGMGSALSLAAVVAHFAFGLTGLALVLVALITVAATLESALGLCIGCKVFAGLMRLGVIPESTCVACNNIALRYPTGA